MLLEPRGTLRFQWPALRCVSSSDSHAPCSAVRVWGRSMDERQCRRAAATSSLLANSGDSTRCARDRPRVHASNASRNDLTFGSTGRLRSIVAPPASCHRTPGTRGEPRALWLRHKQDQGSIPRHMLQVRVVEAQVVRQPVPHGTWRRSAADSEPLLRRANRSDSPICSPCAARCRECGISRRISSPLDSSAIAPAIQLPWKASSFREARSGCEVEVVQVTIGRIGSSIGRTTEWRAMPRLPLQQPGNARESISRGTADEAEPPWRGFPSRSSKVRAASWRQHERRG